MKPVHELPRRRPAKPWSLEAGSMYLRRYLIEMQIPMSEIRLRNLLVEEREPPENFVLPDNFSLQDEEVPDFNPDISDRSLYDLLISANPLSISAHRDVKHRWSTVKDWLMAGAKHNTSFISEYAAIPAMIDPYVNLIEDVCILMHNMMHASSLTERYVHVVTFCKLRGSRIGLTTTLLYIMGDMFGTSMQESAKKDKLYEGLEKHVNEQFAAQDEEYDNIFAEARAKLNYLDKIKETVLYKKVYKLCLYALVSGIFDHTKISFESMGFQKFEEAAARASHQPGVSMVHCLLDTVLFICDRGHLYFHSGDSNVFLMTGSTYDKWVTKATVLIRESKFLSNPQPHGIIPCKFHSDLKDCIERGKSIVKFTAGLEKSEKLLLTKILNDLQLIDANEITKKDASKPRKDPFAILIHGSSSIAKSQLKQILFYHYGKCFNLPVTSEFMYTRIPTDAYWSMFNSSMWCIVMDDIAFLKPNGEIDPSLAELIQVNNPTPFTPPQADLCDKGRTPVKAELIIATTNIKNLNLHDYFACPFAVARRLPYVLSASVKPEYSRHGIMLDSTKVPVTLEGDYMNIWNFEVSIPVPSQDTPIDNMRTKYVITQRFDDIHDMLEWYIKMAKRHEVSVMKALAADNTMSGVVICQNCYRAQISCKCALLEIGETESSEYSMDSSVEVELAEEREEQEEQYEVQALPQTCPCGNCVAGIFTRMCPYCSLCDRVCNCFGPQNKLKIVGLTYGNHALAEIWPGKFVNNIPLWNIGDERGLPIPRNFRITKFQLDSLPANLFNQSANFLYVNADKEVYDLHGTRHTISGRIWVPGSEPERSRSIRGRMRRFRRQDEETPIEPPLPIPEPPLLVPETLEDLNMADLRIFSRVKYWIYAQIIEQSLISYECEFMLWHWLKSYSALITPLFVALGITYKFVFPLAFTLYVVFSASKYLWVLISIYYQWSYGSLWKYKIAMKLFKNEYSAYRFVFRQAQRRIQSSVTPRHVKYLKVCFMTVVTAKVISLAYGEFLRTKKSKYTPQADVSEIKMSGCAPNPMEFEKPTFYYNGTYAMTDVDISNQSKNCQPGVLENKVRRNTARFIFRWKENVGKKNSTIGLNVSGKIWMFNAHAIKGSEALLDVILDPTSQNVSRNVHNIGVCTQDIVFIQNTDLAFIQIAALQPGPSIVEYFPRKDLIKGVLGGEYFFIDGEGVRQNLPVANIKIGVDPVFGYRGYLGRVSIPTVNGQCGGPCIISAGKTKVILGVHTSGSPAGGVGISHVSQLIIMTALQQYDSQPQAGIIPIDAPTAPRELGPLHQKSPLRFVPNGTATVLGSFTGYRPQHKSKVIPTFIRDAVVKDGYLDTCGAPDMTWKPWSLALNSTLVQDHSPLTCDIQQCEDAFFEDIIKGLPADALKSLEVYDLDTALNGVDGVTYVDRLNINTSAGNPFKKSKKHFLTLDEKNKIRALDDVIVDRMRAIEECYDNNTMFHPQFCQHLKDEPLPQKKIDAGGTRVFSGVEMAWAIQIRRYLLSHIRLIQNHPHVFEAMPGVVAQSKEWQLLHEILSQYGEHKIVAGDYKKFDQKMIAKLILSAFNILIRLAKRAGWSEDKLKVLRCMAHDTAYASIEVNGDFIQVQLNPSGHPLTVIINCLVNSLYIRYAFLKVSKKPLSEFKTNVALATYGDDNIMGVSDNCPEFNHTTISEALSKIGITYTMAEKDAESVPYVNIADASFLKRKFRWDADIGAIVAPLDHSSIDKMLTSHVENTALRPEAHAICVIETALREYFYYGKDIYTEKLEYFTGLVDRCNLNQWVQESTFPAYETLVQEFYDRSKHVVCASDYQS